MAAILGWNIVPATLDSTDVSSHYIGRQLTALGHDVRLIPVQ